MHSRVPRHRQRRTITDNQAIGLAVGSVLTSFCLVVAASTLMPRAPLRLAPGYQPVPPPPSTLVRQP